MSRPTTSTSDKASPAYVTITQDAESKKQSADDSVRTAGTQSSANNNPIQGTIGKYEILETLGRGAMGVVYRSYDTVLKREVALKVLAPGYHPTIDEINRFRGEASIAANLIHPHIVQIFDIDQDQANQPFIVLEYVDGGTLDRKIQGNPQAPRFAAETIETLALAVQFAHDKDVIHRDLKPANILITKSGTLKITDFGLAKRLDDSVALSRTGDIFGTPGYMAPEQAAGKTKEISKPADIYALGAILYEMLTGRPPFKGVSLLETLEQIRFADPAPPSRLVPRLHRDLSTICLTCLNKSPAKRYPSALALAEDLRRWLDGHAIHARPAATWEQVWRAIKRRPTQAVTLISLISLVVLSIVLIVILRDLDQQKELRQRESELQELKKQADAEKEAQNIRIRKQGEQSLDALNDIVSKLTDPNSPLAKIRGLEVLHRDLLQYYNQLMKNQDQDRVLDPKKLGETYVRLARLIKKAGDKATAIQAYLQAQKAFESSESGEKTTDKEFGKIYLEIGILEKDLAQFTEAESAFSKAISYFTSSNNNPAEREELQLLHAEVWHQRGVLLDQMNQKEESLKAYEEGLKIRETLAKEYKDRPLSQQLERDLARSHGYLGDVYLDLGRYHEADKAYWASQKIRERLALTHKENNEYKFQYARSWGNFGNYQIRVRAFDTAISFFDKARELQVALDKEASYDTEYQEDLGQTLLRIAELKILGKDPPAEVLPLLNDARKIYRSLENVNGKTLTVRAWSARLAFFDYQVSLMDKSEKPNVALLNQAERRLTSVLSERKDGRDAYVLAQVQATLYEATKDQGAQETLLRDALKNLDHAIECRYRQKHPEDVRTDPAFQCFAAPNPLAEEFLQVVRKYEGKFYPKAGGE